MKKMYEILKILIQFNPSYFPSVNFKLFIYKLINEVNVIKRQLVCDSNNAIIFAYGLLHGNIMVGAPFYNTLYKINYGLLNMT